LIAMTEQERFGRSLAFTLKWEGGYSNDKDDPGYKTNFGISKRFHPNTDIKNLTEEQASAIYYTDYWLKSGAILTQWPACLAIFDTAVNIGVRKVIGFISKMDTEIDPWAMAKNILENRKQYYEKIVEKAPIFQKYINGWFNRIEDLKKYGDIK